MKMVDVLSQLYADITKAAMKYNKHRFYRISMFMTKKLYKKLIKKARKELLRYTKNYIYTPVSLIDLCMLSDMAEKLELIKNDDGAVRCSFIKGDESKSTMNVGILVVNVDGSKGSIKLVYETFDDEHNLDNTIKITIEKEGSGEDLPISKVLSERTVKEFDLLRYTNNPKTSDHSLNNVCYTIFKESIIIIAETIMDNLKDRLLK